MLPKFLGRGKSIAVPSGYVPYSANEFLERFGIASEAAQILAADYQSILGIKEPNDFSGLVFSAKRDLHRISVAIESRYDLDRSTAARVAGFVANVGMAHAQQRRQVELGIIQCRWLVSTCGTTLGDPNVLHAELLGKLYDPSRGLSMGGKYLLPGVAIGCTCIGKPILPGFS